MVYLLHFSVPYKHARHYIGAAPDLPSVLKVIYEPATYSRSPLLIAAHAAGVRFQVANLEPGDEQHARRWRARRSGSRICSVCRDERRALEA